MSDQCLGEWDVKGEKEKQFYGHVNAAFTFLHDCDESHDTPEHEYYISWFSDLI